jgi:predicted O-methyltransferase YrrM
MPGLHLICVDPWRQYGGYLEPKKNQPDRMEDAYQQACTRLAPYHCDIKRMPSEQAAKTVPDGSLDFIFIDGNHAKSYVLADLEAWVPKVRSGGICAGHDYELVPKRPHLQVKAAVDEWRQSHETGRLYVVAHDKTPSFFWLVA